MKQCVRQHDPTTANIPFQNMLDKGYRVNASVWRHGKQRVIQPNFSRCDRRFTSFEVARSAAVASDRGGNERAVKYMKLSHYVKAGLINNESVQRMSDVWLAWGWTVNFLFKPIH